MFHLLLAIYVAAALLVRIIDLNCLMHHNLSENFVVYIITAIVRPYAQILDLYYNCVHVYSYRYAYMYNLYMYDAVDTYIEAEKITAQQK